MKNRLTRVIADTTGTYEVSSHYGTSVNTQDGPLYYFVNCCSLCELSWSGAFRSRSGIFSLCLQENDIKIQPVNVACANTGLRLHFSRSVAPCCALNMYPVTCQWSHFTYPTEICSELAGLTTLKHRGRWTPPVLKFYFDRGP